jgi:proteasome lid subunit RPN8/RPN11
MGVLRVPLQLRQDLERWARESYPREACALLIGSMEREDVHVAALWRARNLELQRPSERFELDPADHLAAERGARALGLAIVGIWHTHPDGPARPSAADRAGALDGWVHLISSVGETGAMEFRAWILRGARFAELQLDIGHECSSHRQTPSPRPSIRARSSAT